MDVFKTINKSLNGYIFNLSEKISEEHGIPIEDILKVWCEQQNISFTTVFLPMMKISKKQQKLLVVATPVPSPPVQNEVVVEDSNIFSTYIPENVSDEGSNNTKSEGIVCEYIFTRGSKKGQRCTTVAKSGNLCSKHKTK